MRAAPRETAFFLAAFLDRPGQRGLDRRGRLVDVVAIEAETGFKAQAVPRAKTCGLTVVVGKEGAGDFDGLVFGDGNLIAVLAGVAQTRDPAFDADDLGHGGFHELQLTRGRAKIADNIFGSRALNGNQRAVENLGDFDTFQIGLHMRDVLVAQGRVHHDKISDRRHWRRSGHP